MYTRFAAFSIENIQYIHLGPLCLNVYRIITYHNKRTVKVDNIMIVIPTALVPQSRSHLQHLSDASPL
jgi:hypothetical protein